MPALGRILKLGRWLGPIACAGVGLGAGFSDRFADRELLLGDSALVTGSNVGATLELGEPRHADKPGGHSVWISWLAPTNGLVTLSTEGSTFDTVLAAYTLEPGNDPPLERLHEAAENDDNDVSSSSLLQFSARAGVRYEIAVDGFAGATGSISLRLDLLSVTNLLPTVVRWPDDRALREGDTLILTVDIDRQSVEALDVHWFFNDQKLDGQDSPTLVIANFQDANVGRYRVRLEMQDATFFSTPIEVQINSEGQTNVLARNKLEDAISSGLTPGGGGSPGFRGLTAASIGGGVTRGYNGAQVFDTSLATRDPLEPQHCGISGGPTYWFSYQPPANGILHLNTDGSTYDTLLAVYTYNPPLAGYQSLIQVVCDDNSGANGLTSKLEFAASSARTYFIVVDGVNGARGIARLNYALVATNPPPPGPVITRQPASCTAAAGNTIALDVLAAGATPMIYQWFRNAAALTDQTNATLTLNLIQPSAAGLYQVGISNVAGSVTSAHAVVAVMARPAINIDPNAATATLAFPAARGFQYRVEMAEQLQVNGWSLLTNALTDDAGMIWLTNSTGGSPCRFYRLLGP